MKKTPPLAQTKNCKKQTRAEQKPLRTISDKISQDESRRRRTQETLWSLVPSVAITSQDQWKARPKNFSPKTLVQWRTSAQYQNTRAPLIHGLIDLKTRGLIKLQLYKLFHPRTSKNVNTDSWKGRHENSVPQFRNTENPVHSGRTHVWTNHLGITATTSQTNERQDPYLRS